MNEDGIGAGPPAAPDRSSWPVRKYRLGEEPNDDLSKSTTPEGHLAMMWPLTLEAWTLAGKPIPDIARARMPVRRIPPGGFMTAREQS